MYDLHAPYVTSLINLKASQIIRRPGFSRSDREDIEQTLLMDLHQRLRNFNPNKGDIKRFIWHTIERCAASIVRHRDAQMRDPRREECSLNEVVRDDDEREVFRSETQPEIAKDTTRQAQLAIDIRIVINQLPGELRDVCQRWLDRLTTNPSGRQPNVSEQIVEQLCKAFKDAGLDEYLSG